MPPGQRRSSRKDDRREGAPPTDRDAPPNAERLPQALEAERSLLGSMLRDNNVIGDIVQIVHLNSFYLDAHQKIFKAIVDFYDKGQPVDAVMLSESLKQRGEIEDVGGYAYIADLWNAAPTAANALHYAHIVRDRALVRTLIHTSTEILRDAYDNTSPADELIGGAERRILEVAEMGITGQTFTLGEALAEAYDRIDSRQQGDNMSISGLPTGYADLDEITAGLQNSEMIIIAARPSVGKTAFALNIVRNIIVDDHQAVFFVSLEQSRIELAERLLCSQARVNSHDLRKGTLSSDSMQRLIDAGGALRDAKLFIDDSPGQGMLRIGANARRLRKRHNIRVVIIDYLQLIEPENRRDPRQEQVAQISRRLKALARELTIPVIALAQVNRASEDRQDHRPRVSDLRESGCLTGDTLVTLADTGRRVPIRELAGQKDFHVWALDEQTLRLRPARVSNAFCTGRKPVYRLRTRLGREIRATANHPFRVLTGWKRLDELTLDERIAVPRVVATPQPNGVMSHQEVGLLGHLIGDGCTLPRHAIQYTTRELDLAEQVAQFANHCFGSALTPRVRRERGWYQVYLSAAARLTRGKRNPVASWMSEMEVFGLRSHEKHVPAVIFQQPREVIAAFLRHLWATDGCIRAPQKSSRHPAIYYASSSKQLANDVQDLLLRFGISAVQRVYSQGAKGRDQYHVMVMGRDDIICFAEQIGAVGKYKSEALQACLAWVDNRLANTNRDIIPSAVWKELVVPAMRRHGITQRALQKAIGMQFMGTGLYKQNVSRKRLTRVAEAVPDPQITALATSDIYWDEIESITLEGEEEVFDLTVPEYSNFVANGIVVHNSIEQDADTIFLLHRPERFEPGQEGIVEVIIGKQRNGPVGEVTLSYVKQYMRYENFRVGTPFES